jgi:hypothetical protein
VTVHSAEGGPLSSGEVLDRWSADQAFRSFFIGMLNCAPRAAYRWETPAITTASLSSPFECALVDEPALVDTLADPSPFAEHIGVAGSGADTVVRFANLRGDAVLVVPREVGPRSSYGHLAAFARGAPVPQQHELWRQVAAATLARVGSRPVWLSTAGLGVPWLHVRLDDRPKYYAFAPYRTGSV